MNPELMQKLAFEMAYAEADAEFTELDNRVMTDVAEKMAQLRNQEITMSMLEAMDKLANPQTAGQQTIDVRGRAKTLNTKAQDSNKTMYVDRKGGASNKKPGMSFKKKMGIGGASAVGMTAAAMGAKKLFGKKDQEKSASRYDPSKEKAYGAAAEKGEKSEAAMKKRHERENAARKSSTSKKLDRKWDSMIATRRNPSYAEQSAKGGAGGAALGALVAKRKGRGAAIGGAIGAAAGAAGEKITRSNVDSAKKRIAERKMNKQAKAESPMKKLLAKGTKKCASDLLDEALLEAMNKQASGGDPDYRARRPSERSEDTYKATRPRKSYTGKAISGAVMGAGAASAANALTSDAKFVKKRPGGKLMRKRHGAAAGAVANMAREALSRRESHSARKRLRADEYRSKYASESPNVTEIFFEKMAGLGDTKPSLRDLLSA